MAVTIGTYGATGASGWSTFDNPAAIYCVSAAGNDTTGNGSFATPYLTTAKAYSVSLAGGNGRATWILMRKGDTFSNQMLGPYDPTGANGDTDGISGLYGNAGASNPMVWSSYDPAIDPATSGPNPSSGGARPIIQAPMGKYGSVSQGGTTTSGGNWVAHVGLDIYQWRNDPTNLSTYGRTLTAITATGGNGLYNVGDTLTLSASNGTTFETAKVVVGHVTGGNPDAFFFSGAAGPNGFGYSGVFKVSDLPTAFTQSATTGSGTGATFSSPVYGSGDNAGISTANPFAWWLIEDCVIRNFTSNGVVYSNPGPGFPPTGANWYIRRCIPHHQNGSGIDGACVYPWIIEETSFVKNGFDNTGTPGSALVHNIYCSDLARKGDLATQGGGLLTFRGNFSIDSASADQFRAGAVATDNCWLRCPWSHIIGNTNSLANVWQNNIYLEGKTNTLQNFRELSVGAYGGGYSSSTGTALIDGNIATKSTDLSGGSGMVLDSTSQGATFSNNIFYKWSPTDMQNGIGAAGNFCISQTTGGIVAASVTTAGTGYTDLSQAVTAIGRESSPSQGFNSNYVLLTVASTAGINSGGSAAGACAIYLDGFTGTGAAAINGKMWLCTLSGANQIIVFGTDTVGTLTGGGTVYIPYYALAFTGGSGSGFTSDVIVKGGAVVALYLAGSEGNPGGNHPDTPGSGYAISDNNLSVANGTTDLLGNTFTTAGTHFIAKVDALNNLTDGGGNQYHIAGGGAYPDPERTSATYSTSLGGGGTTDAFIASVLGQSKANWNPQLTANNGLNPYIRAGFLGGGVTPTPSPGRFMGNRYGVYKTRPTKIPHAS